MLKRLSEWLLGYDPVAFRENYAAAQKQIDGLVRLNETLNADLQVVSDEVACWRRKNQELLESYDARYDALAGRYNDLVGTASIDHAALPFALSRVEEQEKEIDRLRKLLEDQVANIPLVGVGIKDGAVEIMTRPPHWALRAMAASFLDTLGDAPNWAAVEIGPIPSDGGMLIATVRRANGESPVETVGKLRDAVDELVDVIHGIGESYTLTPKTKD